MIRFSFDGNGAVFTAHGHGPHWNDWLCPIVDTDTLRAVISRLADITEDRHVQIAWDAGNAATFTEYDNNSDGTRGTLITEHTMRPTAAGHFCSTLA